MEISGTVKKFVRNDHGDVDGFLLSSGDRIHFPPHHAGDVREIVIKGDSVTIRGKKDVGPDGKRIIRARRIETELGRVSILPPRKKAGGKKKAKGLHPRDKSMEVLGIIEEYACNPDGHVDGLILMDESVIKVPGHLGDGLQALFSIGESVHAVGRRHETRHGDVHLHAEQITSAGSGKVLHRRPPNGSGQHARLQQDILRELKTLREMMQQLLDRE